MKLINYIDLDLVFYAIMIVIALMAYAYVAYCMYKSEQRFQARVEKTILAEYRGEGNDE